MSETFLCRRGKGCDVIETPAAVEAIAQELYVKRADVHRIEHGDYPEDGVGLMVECLDAAERAYLRLLDEALTIDAEWTDIKQRREGMRQSVKSSCCTNTKLALD